MPRPLQVVLGMLLLNAGCMFQNISAEERLREAVMGLNDEARWCRLDLAAQRVAAPFRRQYVDSHRKWGEAIQIADSEVTNVETLGGRDKAVAIVSVRWYREDTMTLATTKLKQKWVRVRGNYVLVHEHVHDGDVRLLDKVRSDRVRSDKARSNTKKLAARNP